MDCGQCGTELIVGENECSVCGAYVKANFFAVKERSHYKIKSIVDTIDFMNHKELDFLLRLDRDTRRVVFDFTGVSFIDSRGLGGLVDLSRQSGYTGQDIRFVIDNGMVMKSINALGLQRVLNLNDSMEKALEEWQNKKQ